MHCLFCKRPITRGDLCFICGIVTGHHTPAPDLPPVRRTTQRIELGAPIEALMSADGHLRTHRGRIRQRYWEER